MPRGGPDSYRDGRPTYAKASAGRHATFQGRVSQGYWNIYTEVVELVDTHVSGACVERLEGSSPSFGTFISLREIALS